MHSATIKYFKTLELIHFQIKHPKRGQAKAKEGRMLPSCPLKETLIIVTPLKQKNLHEWIKMKHVVPVFYLPLSIDKDVKSALSRSTTLC